MSSVFELDSGGARTSMDEAMHSGVDITADVPPSFFEGVGTGFGEGIMRGGARTGQFLGMAAAAPAVLFDKVAGTESADSIFRTVDDYVHSAVDYWTPSANEVGTAGRVLGGLSEIALPLAAGGGNPALLIGSQEMGTATDLVRQGANANAAVLAGVAQGFGTAIGFKLPFLGSSFLGKAATGAAGNLATNAATAAVSRDLLELGGNPELGEQFDPWDAEARLTDVLTGIAFGGIAHWADRPPSVRDAAAVAVNAKHFQQDTAPGIPVDTASSVGHQNAMESAMRSLLADEPVAVMAPEGAFLKRPEAELAPAVQADIKSYPEPKADKSPAMPEYEAPESSVKPTAPSADGEAPDPIVIGAREAAIAADHTIPIEDENGNVSTISARDLLARSDEAVSEAKTTAKAFAAAATCFLQVGQ